MVVMPFAKVWWWVKARWNARFHVRNVSSQGIRGELEMHLAPSAPAGPISGTSDARYVTGDSLTYARGQSCTSAEKPAENLKGVEAVGENWEMSLS